MTKPRRKPSDPMRLAAWHEAEEARVRHGEDVELLERQPDVEVTKAIDKPHFRLDVFAMLHQRRTLSSDQLLSVRRLEEDILAHRGMDSTQSFAVTVDQSRTASLVTDRMIDAGNRVEAVFPRLGAPNARLLIELLDPMSNANRLGLGWRDIVTHATECESDRAMAEIIRMACMALCEAYRAIDNSPRERAA